MIGGFIETYLQLNAEEMKQYEREFAQISPEEQEATMELMTSWERKGREEGLQEGRQEGQRQIIARMLAQRFGSTEAGTTDRIRSLSSEKLRELGDAMIRFTSLADLEAWLSQGNHG